MDKLPHNLDEFNKSSLYNEGYRLIPQGNGLYQVLDTEGFDLCGEALSFKLAVSAIIDDKTDI